MAFIDDVDCAGIIKLPMVPNLDYTKVRVLIVMETKKGVWVVLVSSSMHSNNPIPER